jgi:membrane fusion protein (multidrug efflux system)
MANPRKLIGIGGTLVVLGTLVFFGYKKVTAATAKKADSTATAAGKAPVPARPDSMGQAFGAGSAVPVVGAEVQRGPLIMWARAQGEAASSHLVVAGAEAGGRVVRVVPNEFDQVRAGDTLILLDTTELVFNLRSARNSVTRAEVSMRNQLIADHLIPDPAVRKEREAAIRMSSGLVDAELNLERAVLEYSKAATRAPISGRVSNVKVVPGMRVGAGAEILTIAAANPIYVNAQVMQSEVTQLGIGNTARIVFGSASDTTYTGRVVSINPIVEAGTRTARVTVEVANPRNTIFPGMTARVDVQARTYQNRLMVPRKAILQRSDGRDLVLVFIPSKDGTGEGMTDWRYVALGLGNSEYVEIVPGTDGSQKMVEPGEIVLIEGHYTLDHQVRVKLVPRLSGAGGRPL